MRGCGDRGIREEQISDESLVGLCRDVVWALPGRGTGPRHDAPVGEPNVLTAHEKSLAESRKDPHRGPSIRVQENSSIFIFC